MSANCWLGDKLRDEYFQHAAECPDCQAASQTAEGACSTCGHVPGVLSETLTSDPTASPAAPEGETPRYPLCRCPVGRCGFHPSLPTCSMRDGPALAPAPPAPALVERDGKALHWSVSVERNGENLVVIESNCLSGKPEFTDAEADTIREAAAHLLAFIGRPSPLPSGPPAPVAMPEIQVGDVLYTPKGNQSYRTIRSETAAHRWNEHSDRVRAIYRDPIWRRTGGGQ